MSGHPPWRKSGYVPRWGMNGARWLVAAVITFACAGCAGRNDPALAIDVTGDAQRGASLIRNTGCVTCHTIPGIRGANGLVGPPLTRFARRGFIAGRLTNEPGNLVRWIYDPRLVDPETAMPRVGLDEQQARDVAAYLYTLR